MTPDRPESPGWKDPKSHPRAVQPQERDLHLEDLRTLQSIKVRLSAALDLNPMLEEVLNAALSLHGTDMGMLSLCSPEGAGLIATVSTGLPRDFLRQVEFVRCGVGACGTAMQERRAVVIEDVEIDPIFEPFRAAARAGGVRAVHCAPLIPRSEKIVGTLAVHFRTPHRPSEREIRLLDLYARQAADLIEDVRLRDVLRSELEERKAAEAALRASERRLRIAVDMSRLSVYDWDPNTGALNWDARLKAMWGLSPDAFVDFDVFLKGVHPDDRAYVVEKCTCSIDPAGDGVYEAEFRTVGIQDGIERWVIARGQTFFENNKPVGYVGGAMEITERKRAEERLERKVAERTAQLAASNARLEEYVYSIAHDIRAPLRSMQSFARLLLEDHAAQLDTTAQGYAQRIVRAAGTLDAMVMDLLSYGRVMRASMALTNTNVGEVWGEAVQQQEHVIRERDAMIEAAPECAFTLVVAHRATLIQVLANLLANALKFVRPEITPRIRLRVEPAGDAVRLWVEDNGIGIAPEYHEKIFRVFERLHGNTYAGTGIGLAIVRTGIERMGGRVGVVSDAGTGARFWLDLPRG